MDNTKLEIRLDQHEVRLKNLEKARLMRKPHRCPICQHRYIAHELKVDEYIFEDCKACKGTGVVWS